jgi:hypothetical protein
MDIAGISDFVESEEENDLKLGMLTSGADLNSDTFFKIQVAQRDLLAARPVEPCHLVSC